MNGMDSGGACLWRIVRYYDPLFDEEKFRAKTMFPRPGTSPEEISQAAERIGFRTRCVRISFRQLMHDAPLPCILKCDQHRYMILEAKKKWLYHRIIRCWEPGKGAVTYKPEGFLQQWAGHIGKKEETAGDVIILEPTFSFRNRKKNFGKKFDWSIVLQFFRRSWLQVAQLITALLLASLFQFLFPFLMQSIVDVGVKAQDLNYITVVLIAQLMLVFSRLGVDLIRGRLLLYISTTVNLALLSDFWIKLTRLPLSFYDRHPAGEILQRINDNRQVQDFLTGPALNTIFSTLNFIVFGVVLMMYKAKLFLIFLSGMVLYLLWMRIFLSVRRRLNYLLFDTNSSENNTSLQLVQGMQDIRLNNIEQAKRWEWEGKQVEIFRLNFKKLSVSQVQQAGAMMINSGKDVLLTFTVAKLLVEGQLTFGAMLAVQYIIGQLGGPVEQLIGFIQNAQDAKISMERLNEVHENKDEEEDDKEYITQLPARRSIHIRNLSFTYPNSKAGPVLRDIDLDIPQGRTTAIVGESGSGKTTLMKLLLKFHTGYEGNIDIGGVDFNDLSPSFWRRQCASVLQDSFIFNDTIGRNIALGFGTPDKERLHEACHMANLLTFIESLPEGFDTVLGSGRAGISQGQKQRLFIARALYRDPRFLFLDESTNSLDEATEAVVVENLEHFSENRTVVVIAHRLSTVMNAHNIVVMQQGRIVEQGTHEELTAIRGKYYRLIRNQLELKTGEKIE